MAETFLTPNTSRPAFDATQRCLLIATLHHHPAADAAVLKQGLMRDRLKRKAQLNGPMVNDSARYAVPAQAKWHQRLLAFFESHVLFHLASRRLEKQGLLRRRELGQQTHARVGTAGSKLQARWLTPARQYYALTEPGQKAAFHCQKYS